MIFRQFEPDENNDIELSEVIDILSRLHVPANELELFKAESKSRDGKKINRDTFVAKYVNKPK